MPIHTAAADAKDLTLQAQFAQEMSEQSLMRRLSDYEESNAQQSFGVQLPSNEEFGRDTSLLDYLNDVNDRRP